MLTVLNAVKLSEDYLNNKRIKSPRINAEILLASILHCKRLDLYLKFDRPLKESERLKYREFISRRAKHEPLQYIVGNVEFFGLELKVSPSVLIPRSETELLVEKIVEQYKDSIALNILDIGTGSGNISIALAKNIPGARVTSIDISDEALDIAKENAMNNEVSDSIEFYKLDILNGSINSLNHKFDLIVSNPPYVNKTDYKDLESEISEFEPDIAVTDFDDGLKFYKRIGQVSKDLLNKNGKLFVEIAQGQADEVTEIFTINNFVDIKVLKDYADIDRIVLGELQ
ncbi:release factor glutamine methyltransferase [bacterium BMS3Abin04]|nr:release factor glutamine methyltransferase [bacterium BMS3Abin04]